MTHALEGDTKTASDRVNKEILIKILEERICDRKFLAMLKDRLNYIFFDTEKNQYITPIDRIPQGGIDSPYLFNIYFKKFYANKVGI